MRISTLSRFGSPAILVCLGAVLLLSSCAKKPQQAIIGKWNVAENQAVVEYRKDGTIVTSRNGQESSVKYKFIDDSHFEMEMYGVQGTNQITMIVTCAVAIDGDKAEISTKLPGTTGTKILHCTRVK